MDDNQDYDRDAYVDVVTDTLGCILCWFDLLWFIR